MKTINIALEILKNFDRELKAQLENDLKNFTNGRGCFLVNNEKREHNRNHGFQVA